MKQQASSATETQTKGSQIIDFRGKLIYVGIDVHQRDWQVAKVHEGVCLGNHRMGASSERLIEHLRTHYPGATFKCVYESCAWGFTLQRQLSVSGMECIVVHAADVSSSDKEKRRKTDKVDALKLARNYASGDLKGIYVPPEDIQKDRNLVRFRKSLVCDLTRSRNRIKSLLKYQGITIPDQFGKAHWSRNFMNWIEQLGCQCPEIGNTLLLMLEEVKLLRQLLLKAEKQLAAMMATEKYKPRFELYMSAPGIGRTLATLCVLEIGDIKRFGNFDQLNDFVGLCPDTADSGESEHCRGITTRRHKQLRAGLIEAAWQAIRIDPALMERYQQLTKTMKGNLAIVRIARKLLRRIRAIQLHEIPYQKGVVA